jgi:hypothetical protein
MDCCVCGHEMLSSGEYDICPRCKRPVHYRHMAADGTCGLCEETEAEVLAEPTTDRSTCPDCGGPFGIGEGKRVCSICGYQEALPKVSRPS